MLQRDYMLNEARKFALLLAKLLGLKADGREEDFKDLFRHTLSEDYDTELETLLAMSTGEFEVYIASSGYSQEMLNALAQMLFVFAEPFTASEQTVNVLHKVLVLHKALEQHHQYDSFDNISKRNHIYSFFKINYGRL